MHILSQSYTRTQVFVNVPKLEYKPEKIIHVFCTKKTNHSLIMI